MSIPVPEKIIPIHTSSGRNVRPMLSPREAKIVSVLSKCGAALRPTLERFWTHPLKGKQKVDALLRWGILWSYKLGDFEVVTLSPFSKKLFKARNYVFSSPREFLKTALASEIYVRAVQGGVSCEWDWESAGYPLQGIIDISSSRAGVLVLFRDENTYLGIKIRTFVICEDDEHIKAVSRMINFPALYTTLESLKEDVSTAFCDSSLRRVRVKVFSRES